MAGGSYVGITQYLAAEQQPPHLAAITPAVAISDLYRDGLRARRHPEPLLRRAVHRRPGRARRGRREQRPVAARRHAGGEGRASRRRDDRVRLPRAPERRRLLPRPLADLPRATTSRCRCSIIGGWRDGLLRGAPEMYRRLARRRGRRDAALHRPVHAQGLRRAVRAADRPARACTTSARWRSSSSSKHLRGRAGARSGRASSTTSRGATSTRAPTSWPPPARVRALELGAGRSASASGRRDAVYVTNPAAGLQHGLRPLRHRRRAARTSRPTSGSRARRGSRSARPRSSEPLRAGRPARAAPRRVLDRDRHRLAREARRRRARTAASRSSPTARCAPRTARSTAGESTPERPYHPHTDPQPIEPGRFYEYDVEIWPTAYELAPGHRLQLRLTSTDLPTHLPGSIAFDRNDPAAAQIDLFSPATNTVKLDGDERCLPIGRAGSCPRGRAARRSR